MAVEVRLNSTFITDNFRVHYSPSNEPADVESHCYIRQNPWKKGDAQLYPLSSGLLYLMHIQSQQLKNLMRMELFQKVFQRKLRLYPLVQMSILQMDTMEILLKLFQK